jgi:hypothetical protein
LFKVLDAAPPPMLQLVLLLTTQLFNVLHAAPAPYPPELPVKVQLFNTLAAAPPPKVQELPARMQLINAPL